jgi:hypothetical protein
MLEDPSSEFGWQPDQDSIDDILATIQEGIDVPTSGAPAVVAFCTDGSRSAQVQFTVLHRVSSLMHSVSMLCVMPLRGFTVASFMASLSH